MKRKLLALLLPLALLAGCGANPSAPRVAGAVSLIPEHEAGDKGDFQTQPQADAAIGNLGANLLRAVRRAGALPVLNRAFEKQFTHLMQGELLDVEADIELLKSTLKMEGGK